MVIKLIIIQFYRMIISFIDNKEKPVEAIPQALTKQEAVKLPPRLYFISLNSYTL